MCRESHVLEFALNVSAMMLSEFTRHGSIPSIEKSLYNFNPSRKASTHEKILDIVSGLLRQQHMMLVSGNRLILREKGVTCRS